MPSVKFKESVRPYPMNSENLKIADQMIERILGELKEGTSVELTLKRLGMYRYSRWYKTLLVHPRWVEVKQLINDRRWRSGNGI